ncbi:MAG: RNA methyltransferase [Spirochaetales bacterium]|nr:RNA methyltransferase [Leptospiraceae bacterium]MCP5480443.1 RNA methyltransferase [Spirochaetales bacterium]
MAETGYLLYGRRTVEEFLRTHPAPGDATAMLLQDSLPAALRDRLIAAFPHAAVQAVPRRELDQRHPGIHHQGVVLHLKKAPGPGTERLEDLADRHAGLLVLLDRIQDPHNLGSIARSAEILGAAALLLHGPGARVDETVHRVSSGASLHIAAFELKTLGQSLDRLKKQGYWICAAVPEAGRDPRHRYHTDLGDLPAASELVLAVGGEGSGLKPLILERADYQISVRQTGKTESLNAGVACALLMDRLINRS